MIGDYIPTPEEDRAHEDRLALIYAPMPWRVQSFTTNYGPSYPHAGTIVGDQFFGTDHDEWLEQMADLHSRLAKEEEEDAIMLGLFPRRGRQGAVADEHLEAAIMSAIHDGLTSAQVKERVGCSWTAINRVRKLRGLAKPRSKRQKEAA